MTRKRKSLLSSTGDSDAQTPDDSKPSSAQDLPVRAKGDKAAPAPAPSASALAKGSLKVFGDDDDITEPVIVKAPAPVEEVADKGDENSDDEAPEAVSTSKVASEVKKNAQATQKAAQAYAHSSPPLHSLRGIKANSPRRQAAADKRKRQQRDVLFKHQAEERKKAQGELKAAAAAQDLTPEATTNTTTTTGRRRRAEKPAVPTLLPAELLDDSSEDEEDDHHHRLTAASASAPRSKRRKLAAVQRDLGRETRDPRDERVGSTVYRVAAKVDERMAPAASKYSRNSKEALLKRGRAAVPARRR